MGLGTKHSSDCNLSSFIFFLLFHSKKIRVLSQRKFEASRCCFSPFKENVIKSASLGFLTHDACFPAISLAFPGNDALLRQEAESATCRPSERKEVGLRNNIHTKPWKTTETGSNFTDNLKLGFTRQIALECLAILKTIIQAKDVVLRRCLSLDQSPKEMEGKK